MELAAGWQSHCENRHAVGLWTAVVLGMGLLVAACAGPRTAVSGPAPGPEIEAPRAAWSSTPRVAEAIPHPHPTAVIYVDPQGTPIWPTPPPSCAVSPVTRVRSDLVPAIGEAPIWMSSPILPVLPWRNDLIRTIWLVQTGAPGDLIVSGQRLEGGEVARFIREGGEGISEELLLEAAGTPRPGRRSDEVRPYRQHTVYLVLSGPGCWELAARLGPVQRTLRFYVYA